MAVAEVVRKAAEVERAQKEEEQAEQLWRDAEAWAHELSTTQGSGIIWMPKDCQRCA